MRFSAFFAWYDFWVGWFWDRSKRTLYVCPLPMIVLMFRFSQSRKCEACKRRPGINEPVARWGHLRHEVEKHLSYVNVVGVFCHKCGRPDSDAGK